MLTSLKTHAYIDNGSCQCLILKSTTNELGLKLEKTGKVPISGYHMTKEFDCSRTCFYIIPKDSSVVPLRQNDVMAVPNWTMSAVNGAQLNALCKIHDHLSHANFPEFIRKNGVSIFIGIDNLDLIHYKQIIKVHKMPNGALKLH